MRLILGSINGDYLMDLVERASRLDGGARVTERVWAAVAYASDAKDSRALVKWCFDNNIPLHFWGRLDSQVAVIPEILNMFLARKSPHFVCKLVKHHHAKVIWWRGYGIYIGSANLSYPAWNSNIEAGCFFEESEMDSRFEAEIVDLFSRLDANATILTDELRDHMVRRANALAARKVPDGDFWDHPSIKHWSGLVQTSPQKARDRHKAAFLDEWRATLQLLRDIGSTVSLPQNRPAWVDSRASPGAQADQFLAAHYYHHTFGDQRRADYERHFENNRADPQLALENTIRWWAGLPSAPSGEDVEINVTATSLEKMLSEDSIRQMTLADFRTISDGVHAMEDYARRVPNRRVGLQTSGVKYTIPQKLDALTRHIWDEKAENGAGVADVLLYVLYGGPDDLLPERIWDAVSNPQWKLGAMGISAYGEIVGRARPGLFPPRNGRTSKALRSLGYDVRVHVS